MADQLFPGVLPVLGVTGQPLAGGYLVYYETGTTTLVSIFANEGATVSLPNGGTQATSVPLDGAGSAVQVFYNGGTAAKCVVYASDGTEIYTVDPCPRYSVGAAAAAGITYAPTSSNPETNVQDAIDAVSATGRLLGVRVFDTAGSAPFTPTTGAVFSIGRLIGGGAGAGAADTSANGQASATGQGGSGSEMLIRLNYAGLTLPGTIDIGAGGAGGAVRGADGSAGSDTVLTVDGQVATAPAGSGSIAQNDKVSLFYPLGGDGGTLPTVSGVGLTLLKATRGAAGDPGSILGTQTARGGRAGTSASAGIINATNNISVIGANGQSYGEGGGGSAATGVATPGAGGTGKGGFAIFWDFAE